MPNVPGTNQTTNPQSQSGGDNPVRGQNGINGGSGNSRRALFGFDFIRPTPIEPRVLQTQAKSLQRIPSRLASAAITPQVSDSAKKTDTSSAALEKLSSRFTTPFEPRVSTNRTSERLNQRTPEQRETREERLAKQESTEREKRRARRKKIIDQLGKIRTGAPSSSVSTSSTSTGSSSSTSTSRSKLPKSSTPSLRQMDTDNISALQNSTLLEMNSRSLAGTESSQSSIPSVPLSDESFSAEETLSFTNQSDTQESSQSTDSPSTLEKGKELVDSTRDIYRFAKDGKHVYDALKGSKTISDLVQGAEILARGGSIPVIEATTASAQGLTLGSGSVYSGGAIYASPAASSAAAGTTATAAAAGVGTEAAAAGATAAVGGGAAGGAAAVTGGGAAVAAVPAAGGVVIPIIGVPVVGVGGALLLIICILLIIVILVSCFFISGIVNGAANDTIQNQNTSSNAISFFEKFGISNGNQANDNGLNLITTDTALVKDSSGGSITAIKLRYNIKLWTVAEYNRRYLGQNPTNYVEVKDIDLYSQFGFPSEYKTSDGQTKKLQYLGPDGYTISAVRLSGQTNFPGTNVAQNGGVDADTNTLQWKPDICTNPIQGRIKNSDGSLMKMCDDALEERLNVEVNFANPVPIEAFEGIIPITFGGKLNVCFAKNSDKTLLGCNPSVNIPPITVCLIRACADPNNNITAGDEIQGSEGGNLYPGDGRVFASCPVALNPEENEFVDCTNPFSSAHPANDMNIKRGANINTERSITSVESGTITFLSPESEWDSCGVTMIIQPDSNSDREYLYAHVQGPVLFAVGGKVQAGDRLGKYFNVDNTDVRFFPGTKEVCWTGPHLHFGIRDGVASGNRVQVDPEQYIRLSCNQPNYSCR